MGSAGAAVLPYIYPEIKLQQGARVALMPDHTKTGAKDGAMHVEITLCKMCAMSWLRRTMQAYEAAGQPITDWITRPMAKDKQNFVEAGLSSAEIANRTKLHMKAAGIYSGHTVHGTRRGSMQDAYERGKSLQQIGESAQIRTEAIVKRYLDPHRHV